MPACHAETKTWMWKEFLPNVLLKGLYTITR